MSKKLYALISSVLTASSTIVCAFLGAFQPTNYVAIISAVGIGCTAANDIMLLFVKEV